MTPIEALAEHIRMLRAEQTWIRDGVDDRLRKNEDDSVRLDNLEEWIHAAEDAIEKLGGRVPA